MAGVSIEEANDRPRRRTWTGLTDDQLLAQCKVDTYRASGPGGQKRNKTSSAVRIRHPATGLIVIAEESRSQHENRARALRRLRQALFLQMRDPVPTIAVVLQRSDIWQEFTNAIGPGGRLHLSRKDPRFWPAVGFVLDILHATNARVSDAASTLGTTTANLVDFLRTDPKVWQKANDLRMRFGEKPLI